MSGTIVFGDGVDWSASSGVFNWLIGHLADAVDDQATRDELRLIDEQNFGCRSEAPMSLAQSAEPRGKYPTTRLTSLGTGHT